MRTPPSRSRRLRALLAAGLLVGGLGLTGLACRAATRIPIHVEPVPEAASQAFEEARSWDRGAAPLSRERARKAAERARELAPDWAAPRRMLDDYRAEDLLGIEALAEHRAALGQDPGDAVEHYLAGRLEGGLGRRRFERAAELDPDLAWAHHGLAVMASLAGDRRLAVSYGRRALARARDSYERSYFSAGLARYHASNDAPRKAIDVLEERLSAPDVVPIDRDELSVQLAMIELSMVFQPEYRRGWARALDLIRTRDLTDAEIDRLVDRMRLLRSNDRNASLELQLALTQRPGVARDRWRATLMLEQRETSLALQLLNRARQNQPEATLREGDRPLLRAARFAASQFALGVEEWLAELPRVVLAEDDLPRDRALRRVVLDARALGPAPSKDQLVQLGEHLVAAGWFREARSVAAALGDHLDEGLRLEDQAAAGLGLIGEFKNLMEALDQRRPPRGPTFGSTTGAGELLEAEATAAHYSSTVRDLQGMLAAMAPAVARSQALLGGETDQERVARALFESPMMEYASVGALVHPGPWYTETDEAAGRGRAGEPVPGLAAVLERLGRFGVFGQLSGGGGPDGTILQRVLAEDDAGEHLGVAWSGTIVWCEGADLKSRAGRMGADISGAALHEGYWVDIDSVRREHLPWVLVQRRFIGGVEEQRLGQALYTRGLRLTTDPEDVEGRRRERRDATTLLGAADRLRLAVLRDRARQGVQGDLVTLDELLEVTAIHEEGHLCDRTRFLPLSQNILAATQFLLSAGVSPSGVARKLEYRAQLVALCDAWDPRVPLVSVLRAAEGAGGGPTPHAAAYRELLTDLLRTLDREVERRPDEWPQLDPDHVLAHQLHWLPPEQVRRLALLQARREGLYSR